MDDTGLSSSLQPLRKCIESSAPRLSIGSPRKPPMHAERQARALVPNRDAFFLRTSHRAGEGCLARRPQVSNSAATGRSLLRQAEQRLQHISLRGAGTRSPGWKEVEAGAIRMTGGLAQLIDIPVAAHRRRDDMTAGPSPNERVPPGVQERRHCHHDSPAR